MWLPLYVVVGTDACSFLFSSVVFVHHVPQRLQVDDDSCMPKNEEAFAGRRPGRGEGKGSSKGDSRLLKSDGGRSKGDGRGKGRGRESPNPEAARSERAREENVTAKTAAQEASISNGSSMHVGTGGRYPAATALIDPRIRMLFPNLLISHALSQNILLFGFF